MKSADSSPAKRTARKLKLKAATAAADPLRPRGAGTRRAPEPQLLGSPLKKKPQSSSKAVAKAQKNPAVAASDLLALALLVLAIILAIVWAGQVRH